MYRIGSLTAEPVALPAHTDLVAPSVARALTSWPYSNEVGIVAIDPALADTAALAVAYDLPPETCANCVIVAGRREGDERVAACVVLANTRADVNNLVRRTLDVRKASFLSTERAVASTEMEYGGITPVGLPPAWRLLIDAAVVDVAVAIIGSGVRGSKLFLPGSRFAELPHAEVVADLGRIDS